MDRSKLSTRKVGTGSKRHDFVGEVLLILSYLILRRLTEVRQVGG